MNATTPNPSAMQVGKALDRLVKGAGSDGLDTEETEALVAALATAPCQTPADLLAVLAHSHGIVQHACAVLNGDDGEPDPKDVRRLLQWALSLNLQAIATLEDATGLPAASFLGVGPTVN